MTNSKANPQEANTRKERALPIRIAVGTGTLIGRGVGWFADRVITHGLSSVGEAHKQFTLTPRRHRRLPRP